MRELGQAILAQRGTDDPTIDLDDVFERGHGARMKYYDARRVAASLGAYDSVIRDAFQGSNKNEVDRDTLNRIAKENYDMRTEEVERIHYQAIKAGILEPIPGDSRKFSPPIPSLTTYLRCGFDPDLFKSRMREHLTD